MFLADIFIGVYLGILISMCLFFIVFYKGDPFRFANDSWFSTEKSIFKSGLMQFDKIQHAVLSIFLIPFGWWGILIIIFYEILQALIPYEKHKDKPLFIRIFVGDGFSWKDAASGIFGLGIWIGTYHGLLELFEVIIGIFL